MDKNTLTHTTWNCKYHIVFAPKFRRKVIYGELREDIREIIKMLCERKGIEILEGELMPDHIHLLLNIPPKYSIAEIMGYLKSKSTLIIFERHANLKYKYGSRKFWCRGILCGHSRKEREKDKRVYTKSNAGGTTVSNEYNGIYRSVYRRGSKKEKVG